MRAVITKKVNGRYPMGSADNIITRSGQYKSKRTVLQYAVPESWRATGFRVEWFLSDNIYKLADETTYY